jgi:hypothetical protein
MALKRKLTVSFEVQSEKGPPHMKVYTTLCKVGTIVVCFWKIEEYFWEFTKNFADGRRRKWQKVVKKEGGREDDGRVEETSTFVACRGATKPREHKDST